MYRKLIFVCVLSILILQALMGQNVTVTFQVNMQGLSLSAAGVHLAGDFQQAAGLGTNWNPGSLPLSDPENDSIFSVSVSIPPGTYSYKFINGNQWSGAENPPSACSFGSTNNRRVSIGTHATQLPPVPFNACNPIVRFSVNLGASTPSPDGLFVTGDFQTSAGYAQNWMNDNNRLFDHDNDGLYETTVSLLPGTYQYAYINGSDNPISEPFDPLCMVADSSLSIRSFTLSVNEQLNLWDCWGNCGECLPSDTATGISGWWNDVVFYQVFVRSFFDKVGNNGIGDFKGLIEKLDYLNDGNPETTNDLGIGALWLMPMMASPSYHGYDITDYYATEPDYGTMQDFEELLEACHSRGIKVIIDHVMNHSSSQHTWFQQSRANQNGFRDWYIWRNTNPGFNGPWGQNVWHQHSSGFYYGLFWGGMPDLNYEHPPVKAEMLNASDFWLQKGVDGFRLDAIKYMIESDTQLENTPETFALLEEFNNRFKAANQESFTVGEVWSGTADVVPYVTGNKLDACFDFDLADRILSGVNTRNPSIIKGQIETVVESYPGQRYATFLTNHDINRVMDFFQNDQGKMRSAAAIYLTLPGIPFVYYGEEIGLNGSGPDEEKRKPMHWNTGPNAGFSTATPWRAVGSNFMSNNVATMESQPNSLLQHYKKLIHLRNQHNALKRGVYIPVESSSSACLTYARRYGQDVKVVVHNLNTSQALPTLSLASSTLQPGTYFVNDLYAQTNIGSVTIDANGGFSQWQPEFALAGNSTWVLEFSDQPLSVEPEIKNATSVLLYPNPTSRQLQLFGFSAYSEKNVVEISDPLGRIVMRKNLPVDHVLDVSELKNGLYWLRLMNDEFNTVLPFVKTDN